MKPSRLKEQLDNKQGRVNHGQDSESLKNKRVCFDSSRALQKMGFVSAEKPLILASYKVAYEFAKNKKSKTKITTSASLNKRLVVQNLKIA